VIGVTPAAAGRTAIGAEGGRVVVETIVLSERRGVLRFRAARRSMHTGDHPDDLARGLAGLTACTPGAVLHSTSWRVEAAAVVLTYVALPDPCPEPSARPVALDAAATAAGPLAPSPGRIEVDAVAAHACRHLALLAIVDEHVALAARALPDLWRPIAKLSPIPAGGLVSVSLPDA
jgi:hypothetical protein